MFRVALFALLMVGMFAAKSTKAQSRDNFSTKLSVSGAVLDPKKGKMLKGATVELKSGSKTLKKVVTDKGAGFAFELDFDRNYTIHISAEGYAAQYIEINTNGLNAQDKYYDYEYNGINIRPATYKEGVDYTMFEQPTMRLIFNREQQGFVRDEALDKEVEANRAEVDKAIMEK